MIIANLSMLERLAFCRFVWAQAQEFGMKIYEDEIRWNPGVLLSLGSGGTVVACAVNYRGSVLLKFVEFLRSAQTPRDSKECLEKFARQCQKAIHPAKLLATQAGLCQVLRAQLVMSN